MSIFTSKLFSFGREKFVLFGDVLSLHLRVSFPEEREHNSKLMHLVREMEGELKSEIQDATAKYLGPEFEVRSISFHTGSIEILVVIGTVGAFYYAISRYKNFVESIELLVSHLTRLVGSFFRRFGPSPVSVHTTWSPGPALVRAETQLLSSGSEDTTKILLWYVILSHAALLSVFIWMIIKRLT